MNITLLLNIQKSMESNKQMEAMSYSRQEGAWIKHLARRLGEKH